MRANSHEESGFTLIELAVVLTIGGLLFLLILPNLASVEGNLRSDARRLAAVFRALGDEAAFTKAETTCRMDLDAQQWTYTLEGEVRTGKPSRGVRVDEALAASSGPVHSGTVELRFTEGGPDETVRFYLSRDDKEMTVTIYPFSGRVVVEDGRVDPVELSWDEPSRPLASGGESSR